MIRNTVFAIALLVPMATIAKTPSAKPTVSIESPIPDCYPCIGPSAQAPKTVVRESPIPDCYPCRP